MARGLLLAVAMLGSLLVVGAPAPAGANVLTGVTASPNPAHPGELITFRGPGITDCFNGSILFTVGSTEYRFGPRTLMTSPWSVTSKDFTRFGLPAQPEPGSYTIGIDCFSDFGVQQTYTTDLTFTIVPPNPTSFRGITPIRLFDSRPGAATVDGIGAGGGAIGPSGLRTVKVTGRPGGPTSDVKAVVLNVTSTGSDAHSFVTVYPTGEGRPVASNLNFAAGQTVANSVVVKVGLDGHVTLYNHTGSTHLIVDLAGWFPASAPFTPMSPTRLLDSRPGQPTIDGQASGGGTIGPGGVLQLKVTGRGGVPATGVSGVVLNVTAVGPTETSFVTVYPSGELRPTASNLNFVAGQIVANLVFAKVGTDGHVNLYNQTGSTYLIADVSGWFPTGSASYNPLTPARFMDTRDGQPTVDGQFAAGGPIGPRQNRVLQITGRGNVPASGVGSVVLNLTAVAPTAHGFAIVYPTGAQRPGTSNLNFAPGQIVANLVVTKVGPEGQVTIYNESGTTHYIVDVAGWFAR